MAANRTRNRVVNRNKPKPQVNNELKAKSVSQDINFNLSDSKWMSSVRVRNFSNFLSNSDDFLMNLYQILSIVIPKVIIEWNEIKVGNKYKYPHCHPIKDDAKLQTVYDTYEQIYKRKLDEGLTIWQFGFTQGVRLICLDYNVDNILVPIFIDHNHLIYPSEHHNSPDYDNFSYCVVCSH